MPPGPNPVPAPGPTPPVAPPAGTYTPVHSVQKQCVYMVGFSVPVEIFCYKKQWVLLIK